MARFPANFTSRASPFLTTLILFVSVAARVKFSAPLIVKVVPKSRCTLPASVVSLPVKSKPLVTNVPLAVVIRVSNLLIASPTLDAVSVPVPSAFVMLYVGPVKVPFSTLVPPPNAVANFVTLSAVSEIFVFCPLFAASSFSMASLIVPTFSAVPSALVILKVGPVTVPSAAIVVPPITLVAKFPTAANLPFVVADKSKEYLRTLSVPNSPPVIASPSPFIATVVSLAFTLYVVTPAVVVVSVVTVVLIPSATFTASCAAVFANSLTLFLPSSDKLLKFLSAALSTFTRVALSKPKVTLPLSPAVIAKPDLGPSAAVSVTLLATKLNPSASLTDLAFAAAASLARYLIDASKLEATTFASPKSTVPLSPLAGAFTVIFVSPFLITKSCAPVPAISFMPDNLSDNLTSRPLAPLVASFSTRMLVFVVVDV